jgi:hypothetical protein
LSRDFLGCLGFPLIIFAIMMQQVSMSSKNTAYKSVLLSMSKVLLKVQAKKMSQETTFGCTEMGGTVNDKKRVQKELFHDQRASWELAMKRLHWPRPGKNIGTRRRYSS